ncbi:MAG: hypothetical protein ACFCUH_13785 [Flavobacteriales bacterium]
MNELMTAAFLEIPKEQVGALHFPDSDVLTSDADRKQRKAALERAMTLGNLEQIKFKIYFEDHQGKRFVDTTIWGVTDERIILKQGLTIPTHRIISIT